MKLIWKISSFTSFVSASSYTDSFPITFSFSRGDSSVLLTSVIALICFPCLVCSTVSLICSSFVFFVITLHYKSSGFCLSEIGSFLAVLLISSLSAETNLFAFSMSRLTFASSFSLVRLLISCVSFVLLFCGLFNV